MKAQSKELSLEAYMDFLHSPPKRPALTIAHLNQIVQMHGFKKILQVPQGDYAITLAPSSSISKVILDALETITLIDPSRSSLSENISPDVHLTLDDVITDIGELNWNECKIISIENISKEKHASLINDNNSNHTAVAVVATEQQPKALISKSRDESTCASFERNFFICLEDETSSSAASKTKQSVTKKDPKGKRKRVPMRMAPVQTIRRPYCIEPVIVPTPGTSIRRVSFSLLSQFCQA